MTKAYIQQGQHANRLYQPSIFVCFFPTALAVITPYTKTFRHLHGCNRRYGYILLPIQSTSLVKLDVQVSMYALQARVKGKWVWWTHMWCLHAASRTVDRQISLLRALQDENN